MLIFFSVACCFLRFSIVCSSDGYDSCSLCNVVVSVVSVLVVSFSVFVCFWLISVCSSSVVIR